jgi:hypothetical protein
VNQEKHVTAATPTPDELRIAERYLSVLDDVSRCVQALRDGDWKDLSGTADDLCRRAALLAEAAKKLAQAEPQPRADVVMNLIASRTGDSQAARLLHPVGSTVIPKTTMTDPFTHPNAR